MYGNISYKDAKGLRVAFKINSKGYIYIMTMQGIKKAFKVMQAEKECNQTQLGERIGMSKANFSIMINKKDYRVFGDVAKIANALNYDVKLIFVDRETGKEIECE